MYHTEHARVMNIRTNRESFAQLVGEHAVRMCELSKAEATDSKRGLMSTWVNVHKLNNEWAGLVTRGDHPDSEFTQVTNKLIHMYSEALGDYVLDKASGPEWRRKMGELVETEQKFFNALGKGSGAPWLTYTASVIEMVNAMDRYGHKSETFDNVAAQCIKNGVLLGSYLDYSLK